MDNYVYVYAIGSTMYKEYDMIMYEGQMEEITHPT